MMLQAGASDRMPHQRAASVGRRARSMCGTSPLPDAIVARAVDTSAPDSDSPEASSPYLHLDQGGRGESERERGRSTTTGRGPALGSPRVTGRTKTGGTTAIGSIDASKNTGGSFIEKPKPRTATSLTGKTAISVVERPPFKDGLPLVDSGEHSRSRVSSPVAGGANGVTPEASRNQQDGTLKQGGSALSLRSPSRLSINPLLLPACGVGASSPLMSPMRRAGTPTPRSPRPSQEHIDNIAAILEQYLSPDETSDTTESSGRSKDTASTSTGSGSA